VTKRASKEAKIKRETSKPRAKAANPTKGKRASGLPRAATRTRVLPMEKTSRELRRTTKLAKLLRVALVVDSKLFAKKTRQKEELQEWPASK